MDAEGDLFPPIVRQLVIIGERTGRLGPDHPADPRAPAQGRRAVHDGDPRDAIEPVLTITLAAAIGGILLAVYLPMFDLIGQIEITPNAASPERHAVTRP